MDEATERYLEQLQSRGLKKTSQRQRILEMFLNTEGHPSVEEFYDLVRAQDPGIGYSTVYRTLKLLAELGIAEEVRLGGLTRFEHKHQHHDHLTCTQCGRSVEFVNPRLEEIQDQVAAEHGFLPQDHRLEIFGLCPDCRSKA